MVISAISTAKSREFRTSITSSMIRYIVFYRIREKAHISKINYGGLRSEVTFITPRRVVSKLFLEVLKFQSLYTMKALDFSDSLRCYELFLYYFLVQIFQPKIILFVTSFMKICIINLAMYTLSIRRKHRNRCHSSLNLN